MRRLLKYIGVALKWIAGVVAACALLVVLLVVLAVAALNTGVGQREAARLINHVAGGAMKVQGISGWFPDALRVRRVELRDKQGAWVTLDDVALDWRIEALVRRVIWIDRLSAARIVVARMPPPAAKPANGAGASQGVSLPLEVKLRKLDVPDLQVTPAVAGTAADVAVQGRADIVSVNFSAPLDRMVRGTVNLAITRHDGAGEYRLSGDIQPARIAATLTAQEPAHGLVASAANLPDLGAIHLDAALDGPWSGARLTLALSAGPLRAHAAGTIDTLGRAADLDVTASAPAMQPRPGVSWQSVALDAHVHGPFTKPDANGTLKIVSLKAPGGGLDLLTADVSGNAGQVALQATLNGLRIPGPNPALLASAPVTLTAHARLDDPARPVTFTLAHPLLHASGRATLGGHEAAQIALTVPHLAPLAAVFGVDLHGSTALAVNAAIDGPKTSATVDGTVSITGGMAPAPALIGDAKIGVTAAMDGQDITLSRLDVNGKALRLAARGGVQDGKIALDGTLALPDLHAAMSTLQGALDAKFHVAGPQDDLAANADISGELAAQGGPRGPVQVQIKARGLPKNPQAQITAQGTLDKSPVALAVDASRGADGALHVTIGRADWKSLHAEGALALAAGAKVPTGKISLRFAHLADLRPFLGQAIGGSINAQADLGGNTAKLTAEARDLSIPGVASVGKATVTASVADPATQPDVDARVDVQGLDAKGITGSAQLLARGKEDALSLKLTSALHGVAGADLSASAAAVVDTPAKTVSLSAFTADWKNQTIRLLAPARVSFGGGIAVDKLRVGLREAVLEVAGRVSPTLDLTIAARNVGADLAQIVAPGIKAAGTLQMTAHFTGAPAHPAGTIKLAANGIHMQTGPGASLPPATLAANADLNGRAARIDARLTAGTTHLSVSGTAPESASGALDLKARGGINLAILDPVMAARGARLRGVISIDAGIAGTTTAPRASGTIRLANGDVQDFAQGLHLSQINALITADGNTIRISQFAAKAGQGTMDLSGTVGIAAPMPVDIHLVAKNATPVASDILTERMDANVTVQGQVQGKLTASGRVHVRRADIQIPEHMPSSVAVLNVRKPGQKPPPPSTGPDIALDLTLDAPQQVFVRGRGLFAELGGTLHLHGTAAKPQPDGGFMLRSGQFSLAGTTLTFTEGKVTFNGAAFDPALYFVATSTSGSITAKLTISGYASNPKITLSSDPSLPQDQVLSQLLFQQNTGKLSPFQLAEIAAALAQITGVSSGGNPLDSIRSALGLDTLSVSGSSQNNATNPNAKTNTGPSLEAGRYVARGVFVGAKQSTSGSGTGAEVKIDLTKRLKLKGDAGTGPGANDVGLAYQFQY